MFDEWHQCHIYMDDHDAFCNKSQGMEESLIWPLCQVALTFLAIWTKAIRCVLNDYSVSQVMEILYFSLNVEWPYFFADLNQT